MTTHPAAVRESASITSPPINSSLIYLGLMAYLVIVKLLVSAFFPAVFTHPSQSAVFSWQAIGILAVLGLTGVWLSHMTGFPAAWDSRVSNRQRLLVPALLGWGFGAFYILADRLIHYQAFLIAYRGTSGSVNVAFPASLLIYPGAAIIVEVIYRLVPMPLLLWLISNLLRRRRGQEQVFWALAILTSLIEPLTQDLPALQLGVPTFVAIFARGFAFNLTQAALFRRYGLLAAIVMRAAFYLIWHVAYAQ